MIGPTLALTALLATLPLQPQFTSWTISPPPPPPPIEDPLWTPWRLDYLHARFAAAQAVTPLVTVLYWRPLVGWTSYRAMSPEPFAAGETRVLTREVPWDVPGPVIVAVLYDCGDRWHSLAGFVPRPGEELPAGVTPFEQMPVGPICGPLNTIFSDGFESGGLGRWSWAPLAAESAGFRTTYDRS